jgi:DNA-directed RNA polymerase subunit L
MTIIEQESCYQVIQLTKEHPSLSNLFLKLQSQGRNWVDILKMLREALEERSDDLMGALPALASSNR